MPYNALTRRHFATAAHAGVLSGPGVQRGSAGSRRLGTWVQFDLQFDVAGDGRAARGGPGGLLAVRFLAFGCPHVIAIADWIAEAAVGRHVIRAVEPAADAAAAAALPVTWGLPESVPALRERFDVPAEKTGRLLVIEDAWIAALSPPSK
jgi:NifU-like protein involved in Fe-S cluster formation